MANDDLQACAYRILRYTPNLVRDEWINVGVVLIDPARRHVRARMIEEPAEFARVRRLHPTADEGVLRSLQRDFEAQFAAHAEDPQTWLARLDETMSNLLQFSPQRGVLTEDLEAEADRLFREHVEAPRLRAPATEANTRTGIRMRMRTAFRSAGILDKLIPGFRVDEFTSPGDPLRLDYSFRRNGTHGFIHALALNRDPGQAKVLAFTTERVRAKLASAEFTAVTETEPQAKNERHAFVAGLLAQQNVELVSVGRLSEFANRLKPLLH
jgi:hypothetical protein